MSKLFPNATIRTSAPYRFDIVGSFLRPETLKQARHQCSCGDISCADLTQVEDAEIAKLVEHQKNVGLHAVTDGEFRRTFWHLDFLAALDGVKEVDAEKYKDRNYSLQEYLDREDKYELVIFVDEKLALIKTVIQVNDWIIQLNDIEL